MTKFSSAQARQMVVSLVRVLRNGQPRELHGVVRMSSQGEYPKIQRLVRAKGHNWFGH